ncbi:MAG: threonylcarbamoyl-AMP synthase [Gammaproteobacteria bacterium]|nr:threonylcarbamoyl-AMP synthase [Gammaproteobacteria bacterium]
MAQYFRIHPANPQKRLINQAVMILNDGGVVIYPTDSCYALGCRLGYKDALERIRRIRNLDERHNLTLLCKDLSDIGTYAMVHNAAYRLMKSLTPGPYTFLLKATRDVPRRLQHPKRKTIGVRVPDNVITLAILKEMKEPLLSTSLILPEEGSPLTDPGQINAELGKTVDLIIDGGYGGLELTTVVDLVDNEPLIVRAGKGNLAAIGT